jgi:AraC-like DNA-binding protein
MKSLFEKVVLDPSSSVKVIEVNGFEAPFSHHPEVELVLIVEGRGTRFIGHHPSPFFDGDLVLLGSNVSHWWKPDRPQSSPREQAIVVQARDDLLDAVIGAFPECTALQTMFDKAQRGIYFPKEANGKVIEKIIALPRMPRERRAFSWMEILWDLHLGGNGRPITAMPVSTKSEDVVIRQGIEYILKNLHRSVSQSEVASVINVSTVHFSRLFKRSVRMSFPEYLHQMRIALICQHLHGDGDLNIAELAFHHGYVNLSNFNRAFKRAMGMTPFEYRKKMIPPEF